MHAIDGYETARKIRKTDSEIVIIFTTSLIQYAIEGYGIGINAFY